MRNKIMDPKYVVVQGCSCITMLTFHKFGHEESSRKRHTPNRRLARKPTTRAIDIRRLKIWLLVPSDAMQWMHMWTYENMTLEVGSCSESSSQKTGGFCVCHKKKGMKGKKNPTRIPCSTEALPGPDCPIVAPLSIHCSSRTRACSSSNRWEMSAEFVLWGWVCIRERGHWHSSSVAKSVSR